MANIDRTLLGNTVELGKRFDTAALRLSGPPVDLRVFFTFAHGYITKKIAKHIGLFANPNALMRLNEDFASTYLNALDGAAHEGWKDAFRRCKAEGDAVRSGLVGLIFIGPIAYEACGACMANVHINTDLRAALKKIRDVDAQDYGNMIVFVMEGNIYAETKIRGVAKGALMVATSVPLAAKLNLNIKQWRNQVFTDCYNKPVPERTDTFVNAYHRAEGR